jgi:hypothetical protein
MLQEDIKKALVSSLSAPAEDIAREIMQMAGGRPDMIEKAITTGTGLVAYDLQAPAKNLYPVNTPIIKSLPRVSGGIGTATNWKAITAITGSAYDNTPWVPEGQRAGQMGYTVANKAASFATIGEEDQATFEAISAGVQFEDVRARMTMRLLQKMMLKEEAAVLFGNVDLALGTPATPTLSASGSGSTLPTLTYSVICVALTMEGLRNSSVAGGVATTKTVTGADGKTFSINGGSSIKSAAATQAVTLGQTLFASTTAIQGAAGYAWFVGAAGAEKLEKITTINSAAFTAPLIGGAQQAATTVGASDFSANVTGFNGLLTTALKAASGAYVKNLATGVAGTGTVLTASGRGSVNEIDDMMQSMWDNNQCSVSVLYVNSQEQRNLTAKCLASGNTSLLNFFSGTDEKAAEYHLTAGGSIEYYYNPYLNRKIPVRVHPNLGAGTILGYAEDLPVQYQSNETPNVAEVKVRRDYYQIDWPIVTRAQMAGVYAEEVLAVYAPFAMGVVGNIANG